MATQRHRHGRFAATLAFTGALAGVLIWSKLRLSTSMPRSAYAVPKERVADDKPDSNGPAAASSVPETGVREEAPSAGDAVETDAGSGEG